MGEIDYGALFGIDATGAEEQDVADPAADTTAQGENEQDVAAPAEQNTENTPADGAAEGGNDSSEEEGEAGQNAEQNAKFAAARRKAEAERDAAVEKAKAEAQAEAARVINEAFKNSGLVNPYTKQPITSKEEYDAYRQRYEAERKKAMMRKSGMSDADFDAFVQNLPEVREAREAKEQAEQAKREAQQAAAKVKVDEQLKEIGALDPSIRSMEDLAKMPTYAKFYELVKKGNTLTDAFKLANYDALTKGAAAGARQAALNAAQGKQHMGQTQTRGAGAVSVPAEVMEQYRAFNPDATEAEIRAHYAKNHKK